MIHSNDNESIVFDRLVDGELSAVERERLLASLDDSTGGWRRCALAFLEAQSWRQGMKQFVAEPADKPIATLPPTSPSGSHRNGVLFLALAASLLLAFTAGWLVRSPGPSGNIDGLMAETAIEENVSPDDVVRNVGPNDAVTLLVRDTEGKPQRFRVPLVDSAGLDDQLGTMLTSLPSGYRDNLQERGYDLRGRRRYAPLYFEQNNQLVPMVVPVDDAYVVPVSRQIY